MTGYISNKFSNLKGVTHETAYSHDAGNSIDASSHGAGSMEVQKLQRIYKFMKDIILTADRLDDSESNPYLYPVIKEDDA